MICQLCKKNEITDRHHKFSQTKLHINLYPEFIHDEKNIQLCCNGCHLSKVSGLEIWSEMRFCDEMGIVPRSKSGLLIYKRMVG
jgi:hypothetical protein